MRNQSSPSEEAAGRRTGDVDVVGMWVTADGHIRQELLPGGRYDEGLPYALRVLDAGQGSAEDLQAVVGHLMPAPLTPCGVTITITCGRWLTGRRVLPGRP